MTLNENNPSGLPLELRSLREQVYEYIRAEIQAGRIVPGSFIKLNEISRQLGISKTPLRDAIIQMECEGFVTILPRRGVLVNRPTLEEIKNNLEIVGALESAVIVDVFEQLTLEHIKAMEELNERMRSCIHRRSFDKFDPQYYKLNIAFHDVFLNLSSNTTLQRILIPIKQRLYDFPRFTYIRDWELINCNEHAQFIGHVKAGDKTAAALLWHESHWSFTAHESYIREFYAQGSRKISSDLKELK